MNHGGMAVALVGPTASGKSALAHELALESEGDVAILAVDAMTVYRGMDLATAKPTRSQRNEVSYRLLDLV
jgi:tRNA dimethylallyltransferase